MFEHEACTDCLKDCGTELYADLPVTFGAYIDRLAVSLQGPGPISGPVGSYPGPKGGKRTVSSPTVPGVVVPNSSGSEAKTNQSNDAQKQRGKSDSTSEGTSNNNNNNGRNNDSGNNASETNDSTNKDDSGKDQNSGEDFDAKVADKAKTQKYLALCINVGGIYKTLSEIDMTDITSDAKLFLKMKEEYQSKRWKRFNFNWLVKPATVEYIEVSNSISRKSWADILKFKFWNYKQSYISVCSRPHCMPPKDSVDYEFEPKGLPPPPMPPEVFIHYLEHGEGDLNANRNDWLPHLPKRLRKHDAACYGYGMHVIEGPHKLGIFIVTMLVLVLTVLASVLWSVLRHDVQGGTGIGALLIACYTAFLTAWIYWRDDRPKE
jgi:hypothetical protein